MRILVLESNPEGPESLLSLLSVDYHVTGLSSFSKAAAELVFGSSEWHLIVAEEFLDERPVRDLIATYHLIKSLHAAPWIITTGDATSSACVSSALNSPFATIRRSAPDSAILALVAKALEVHSAERESRRTFHRIPRPSRDELDHD